MLHIPFVLRILRLKVVISKNACLFFFGVESLTVKSTRESRCSWKKVRKKTQRSMFTVNHDALSISTYIYF